MWTSSHHPTGWVCYWLGFSLVVADPQTRADSIGNNTGSIGADPVNCVYPLVTFF